MLTCGGSNGTTCQGRHGAAYPLGGRRGSHLEAQRPVAPPARRGVPISPEKWGERGPGLCPWTPGFDGRSLALARFGGCAALFRSIGYYEPHVRALIWRLSFAKMLFRIFFRENAFQIGLSIPEGIAPLPYQRQRSPKPASGSKRAIKKGGRGPSPATLCVRAFSRESLDPPPGTGREPTSQGPPCAGPKRTHL